MSEHTAEPSWQDFASIANRLSKELNAADASLRAVRALHVPSRGSKICDECGRRAPCPTAGATRMPDPTVVPQEACVVNVYNGG